MSETQPSVAHRFGYTGQEYDAATGLHYYNARYYDQAAGRFISTDPSGFSSGDVNLYRYVHDNPITYIDPTGLNIVDADDQQASKIVLGLNTSPATFQPLTVTGPVSLGGQTVNLGSGSSGGFSSAIDTSSLFSKYGASSSGLSVLNPGAAFSGGSVSIGSAPSSYVSPSFSPTYSGSSPGGGVASFAEAEAAYYNATVGAAQTTGFAATLDSMVAQNSAEYNAAYSQQLTLKAATANSIDSISEAFYRGLITGAKATVNAFTNTVAQIVSLGIATGDYSIAKVNDFDRAAGYDTATAISGYSQQLLVGSGIGKLASSAGALSKIATSYEVLETAVGVGQVRTISTRMARAYRTSAKHSWASTVSTWT